MQHQIWKNVTNALHKSLESDEELTVSLSAEDSTFIRFNQAKVRQNSSIFQGSIELNLQKDKRQIKMSLPFCFQQEIDLKNCYAALEKCRHELKFVPIDPYIQSSVSPATSWATLSVKVDRALIAEQCLKKIQGSDFVGLLTMGEVIQATFDSRGLDHWFEVSNFCLDFSLYDTQQQAVKGIYAGQNWDLDQFESLLQQKKEQLEYLNRPFKVLSKGRYRTYFSPSAVHAFITILSWKGLSQEAYQQGQSSFKKLIEKQQSLSPLFSLYEDFSTGEVPRFNERGEIVSEVLPLIEKGELKTLLCSTRSAQEYNVPSNYAAANESLRSARLLPGRLQTAHILKELDTGLYVADIHYLNWSDVQEGRLTGMTRFGCFWVENGQLVAPIHNLRFDETFYHFWGEGLVDFTAEVERFPNTDTYIKRKLGCTVAPGMLVNDFTFVD